MTPEQRRAWRNTVFALAQEDLTAAQKLVLLKLETYADWPEGTNARPGVAALAEGCSLKPRVVESALQRGRQLGLIEQTCRANPKRHLAAVYRLTSTRIPARSEDDSTRTETRLETDFNPHESPFQPARDEISTRTLMQPTNPVTPIQFTDLHAAARARELIATNTTAEHPTRVARQLRKQVEELLAEQMDPTFIGEALRRWDQRTDAGAALLPWIYTDVLKERRQLTTNDGSTNTPPIDCPDCEGTYWLTDDEGNPIAKCPHRHLKECT